MRADLPVTVTRSWLLAALSLAAFGQTLFYYLYLRDDPGNYNAAGAFGDHVQYIALAQQIMLGAWEGGLHYMPGYPAVLAFSQWVFGEARFGVAVVQGLVYMVLVVGVARLAAMAFGAHTGPWAAGLVALNPVLGYYAGQALTEFLTGALLFGSVALLFVWSRQPRWRTLTAVGMLCAGMVFVRSEYLGVAAVIALVAFIAAARRTLWWRAALRSAWLLAVVAVALAPLVARYVVATGRPGLFNESPTSNLVLMGTWFRVFDASTFARLQEIERSSLTREEAVARAATVGPRPDLSARYMAQTRAPYDLPLAEAIHLAFENTRLNPGQYVVNHFVLAPFLIWAGHTPVRQGDATTLPSFPRRVLWAVQFALVLAAAWQAVRALRNDRTRVLGLAFLGVASFLTAVHVLVAVDDRFTVPVLPLVGLLSGAWVAGLLAGQQGVAPLIEARRVESGWAKSRSS
jgi:4-amino-4-deoxy-L-arabinose transferase-like glycosyltransferase